jgi:hypothetical protein
MAFALKFQLALSCAVVAVRGLSSDLVGMNWVGLGCQTFRAGRACGPIPVVLTCQLGRGYVIGDYFGTK